MLDRISDIVLRDPILFGLSLFVDTRASGCPCDSGADHRIRLYGCFGCGLVCCAACAITLESVAYCRSCAAAVLNTAAVRAGGGFELV